jgi:hypothetical protein
MEVVHNRSEAARAAQSSFLREEIPRRMGRLIDDLLAFSRLGRQRIEPTMIDMESMAREVFDELAALEPSRNMHLGLH